MTERTTAWTALLDVLFDDPGVGRCLVAPGGTILRASTEWLRSTGLPAGDAIGADAIALVPELRDAAMRARAGGGRTVPAPRYARRIGGRETWWEGSVAPVPIDGGTGLLVTAREVAARTAPGELGGREDGAAAADAVALGEAVLAQAGAMAHLGAWWIDAVRSPDDLNANPLRWSDEVYRIFGYEPGGVAVSNELFFRHVHPDDRERVAAAVARALADRGRYVVEHRIVRRDGEERVVLEHGQGYHDAAGRLVRFVGAVQDITLRKRAEEALRSSEARLRRLYDSGMIGVVEFDLAGAILEANDAFLSLVGHTRADLEQGRIAWDRMTPPEYAPLDAFAIGELRTRGLDTPYEKEYVRRDGSRVSVIVGAALFDDARHRGIAFVLDVTERRRAAEALRESEERYRTLFTHMTEGFALGEAICDEAGVPRDFRLLEMNEAFEHQSGLARERARGRPIREVLPNIEQSWIDTYGAVALGAPALRFESYNGDLERHFSVYCFSPGRGRFAVIFTDITDRRRAEEAVRIASEKLREADRRKDEFLGMLSHELRNPLAPIRNALYILDRAEPTGQQARRAKDVVSRQVGHLTRLVDDLLDVTRIARGKIELRRADLDLAALARRTAEDYRALMQDRGLDLAVELPDAPLVVNGDDTRLAQVLGNLLSNAAKFTPAGGRVSLSLHARDDRALVHVRDTGLGIAPEVLPTIFEPFTQARQTLARSEGGLGLGLALVKGLVALHGGEVTVSSVGEAGTEFVVAIPLAARPAAEVERGRAGAVADAAPHRVLVVDDNADAADTLAELFRLHGHEVEVAYDGPTALEAARARPPDVVLCDLGLPGMDGYEVARRLRAAFPALRLVAVSGYAQPEDVARAADAGFDGHVAKPPDPEKLASLLG
ncbi:MAG TPA: PAS domain S-box protein [Anaeromyxobacter sp.]